MQAQKGEGMYCPLSLRSISTDIEHQCDETKPECERCKRSGRNCEGYDRYPVFIHRTQTGYKKRAPLEEVKKTPTTVISFASPDAEATRLISWFWESFARSPPSKYALQSPSHWLDHFIHSSTSNATLHKALLAVSVTRLSRTSDRPDIIKYGRRMYTQSLGLTRKALADPQLSLHDDILATSCVMTLYELFDTTTNNPDGWLDHLCGVYRLLQHRGPGLHNAEASRALFEHSRYLIMLQHLISRKSCVFGEPEWLECPWQDVEKSVEQQIFDQGLKLTSVLETCDRAIEEGSPDVDLTQLFHGCVEIYDDTMQLQEQSVAPAVDADLEGYGPRLDTDSMIARNPAGLMLQITALGVLLGACVSACDVYYRISCVRGIAFREMPGDMTERTTEFLFSRQKIARRIIFSVRTCINERVGAMGAARMIFPLRLTIRQFQPTDPEMEECKALLQRLSGLANQFRGLIRENDCQVVPSDVELIQGNACALAAQWPHLADVSTNKTTHPCWMPEFVGNLPTEALATWAR